jgi:hypothetical protein
MNPLWPSPTNISDFSCFDIVLRPHDRSWINGLVFSLYDDAPLLTRLATPADIEADPETYYMSQHAYDLNWRPIVGESYAQFGRPLSLNLLWRRP